MENVEMKINTMGHELNPPKRPKKVEENNETESNNTTKGK